jgi:hypothetical protein
MDDTKLKKKTIDQCHRIPTKPIESKIDGLNVSTDHTVPACSDMDVFLHSLLSPAGVSCSQPRDQMAAPRSGFILTTATHLSSKLLLCDFARALIVIYYQRESIFLNYSHYNNNNNNNNNPWRYSSDELWPAEQPPLAVFPDCTRRYWVDMWSAHRIPQLHFQLSKPGRYFFIQVITQFIRSRG